MNEAVRRDTIIIGAGLSGPYAALQLIEAGLLIFTQTGAGFFIEK